MATKGEETREKLLEIAEQLILVKGFAGTSIEEIIAQARITKGGFFYHFNGKNALAVGLLERYKRNDAIFFGELFQRARELTEDPLQQMLLFLKLLAEAMANLPDVHPGCLVATFTYECQQVNEEVRAVNAECLLCWRDIFEAQLRAIAASHPAAMPVDTAELADMLSATLEGGIVMSRALNDQQLLVQQILQYRNYLRLLFGAD